MKIKILGTKLILTFPFAAIIVLLLFIDKSGIFLPLLAACLLHELGHIVAMRFVGTAPKEIVFKIASLEISGYVPKSLKDEAFIALMGPAANFLFFIVFYLIYKVFKDEAFIKTAAIMLALGFVNMLPSYGLDGGDVAYAVLSHFLSKNKSELILSVLSIIIAFLICFAGCFVLINMHNPSITIFGIYLFIMAVMKKGI